MNTDNNDRADEKKSQSADMEIPEKILEETPLSMLSAKFKAEDKEELLSSEQFKNFKVLDGSKKRDRIIRGS